MKDSPEIHYIIFAENGEIEFLNSINKLFRNDIHFIIKRTFVKTSGGKRLHKYFENEVLDANQNRVENNSFKWGKLQCNLRLDEFYGFYQYFLENTNLCSVCLTIEVKDLLGNIGFLNFNTHYYDKVNCNYDLTSVIPFVQIKEDLDLLNKVGSYEGLTQIKKLKFEYLKNK